MTAGGGRVTALARYAFRFELGMWRSLARWALRRPAVEPGGTPFAYRGPIVAPLLVFFVLSVVEVVALDLIVSLPWLRVVLLVLGVWGAVFMLGMLAAVTVRPHVVGPSGLRVRYGTILDVLVPWDAVAAVRRLRRSREGRTLQLDGATLHVLISHETTVVVTLSRPVPVTLPRDRTAEVTELRFHADDAAGLVAAARVRAGARP
ncbi:MAG TPA: hypothetical protein VD813_15140 [Pseudonocardia sp.]|nr:hypothetical protein [Pseudonocardia sp.]